MPIRIRGVAKTKAILRAIEARVEVASPTAVRAGGGVIQREMASRAPRRTGRLASGISMDVTSIGNGASAKVGSDVPYDRFVQKGTVYMSANPYGEEAADNTNPVVGAVAAVYKAALP